MEDSSCRPIRFGVEHALRRQGCCVRGADRWGLKVCASDRSPLWRSHFQFGSRLIKRPFSQAIRNLNKAVREVHSTPCSSGFRHERESKLAPARPWWRHVGSSCKRRRRPWPGRHDRSRGGAGTQPASERSIDAQLALSSSGRDPSSKVAGRRRLHLTSISTFPEDITNTSQRGVDPGGHSSPTSIAGRRDRCSCN
jgi:hypothetical protein